MIIFFRVNFLFLKIVFISSVIYSKTSFPGLDIFSSSLNLGMGGAGYLMTPSPSYSNVNPSMYKGNFFSSSIIKYPASIINQNVGIIIPLHKGFGGFSLNYLSYGTFNGYDEDAQSIGTFNASDTKLTTYYAIRLINYPLNIGLSTNIFMSNYNNYKFYNSTLNMGFNLDLEQFGILLGISIHDIGKTFGDLKINFDPKLVFSCSKKLKHLPLTLYTDLIAKKNLASIISIGGEFQIGDKIQFRLGTSTKKFNQNTKNKIINTILGSTGIGLSLKTQDIFFHYGVFLYGTGAIIQGFEVGIDL
ncbi:MAG: hypothetical protein ACJZ12_02065 [Candidatus Neomarinimicrobiota bacterium]